MDRLRSHSSADVRLDPEQYCLWRGRQRIPLRPKDCTVLQHLAERRGQLVTKADLLEAVWPDTFVTETVLKACIHRLRRALGDNPRRPRFIETIPKRGYRFINALFQTADVVTGTHASLHLTPPRRVVARPTRQPPVLVGRQDALRCLQQWLEQAILGVRQIGFVTGEAGIGKTTVIEAFLDSLGARGDIRIMRGQCLEQYGSGEAYLAMLEALSRLCQTPGQEACLTLLRQHAPTWIAQMPWLFSPAERQALQPLHLGRTRDRMLREITEALEAMAASAPLVLVLEDLHWSDYATLDLIAWLAHRQEPARLLLLGTYRPEAVTVNDHPLPAVVHTLRLHRQCDELALGLFDVSDVSAYLSARFADSRLPDETAEVLHRHTDGNPLFLVNVLDHLLTQGCLRQHAAQWEFQPDWQRVAAEVPENLSQIVVHRLARLQPEDQRTLEAASVAGMEFSAASIAAALKIELVQAEMRCDELAQRRLFLRPNDVSTWPDGTVATQYRFIHTLYPNVIYQRLTAARRQRLHRRIGMREERGYRELVGEIAARLAMHFERGHNYPRAVRHHLMAAQLAIQRCGYHEAITHLTVALERRRHLADTPTHMTYELNVYHLLGLSLAATRGYAAPEVEQTYSRARLLCEQLDNSPQLFPILHGLWVFYALRGALQTACDLARQSLAMAHRLDNPPLLLDAYSSMGVSLLYCGEIVSARTYLEQGIDLYDFHQHRELASFYGQDPGVVLLSHGAWILWLLGYPEQALHRSREALGLARELGHPFSLALALNFAALLHLLRREPRLAGEMAEAAVRLATEQGFTHWVAMGACLQGWALVCQGHRAKGMAQLRQGLEAWQATGARQAQPYLLAILAEAYGQTGEYGEGLRALEEALAVAHRHEERWWEAEIYRLRGELSQHLADETLHTGDHSPEVDMQRALDVARRQGAKSLELRAATSLSRWRLRQGKPQGVHQSLAEIYAWFTEGLTTPDLQAARSLLDSRP